MYNCWFLARNNERSVTVTETFVSRTVLIFFILLQSRRQVIISLRNHANPRIPLLTRIKDYSLNTSKLFQAKAIVQMMEIQPLPFIKEEDKNFIPKLVPLHQLPKCAVRTSTDLFYPHSFNMNININVTMPTCEDSKSEVFPNKERNDGIHTTINWIQVKGPEKEFTGV